MVLIYFIKNKHQLFYYKLKIFIVSKNIHSQYLYIFSILKINLKFFTQGADIKFSTPII